MKVPHTLRDHAAFSLVEVTMAIGIVSFAILSVLGTMSVGLSTVRDAKKDTASAQIAAQIGSGMSQTPFASLAAFAAGGPYFFDDGGKRLDGFQAASFSATVEAVSSAYPGAPSDVLTTSASKWRITVSSLRPGTTNAISSSRFSLLVPKS